LQLEFVLNCLGGFLGESSKDETSVNFQLESVL